MMASHEAHNLSTTEQVATISSTQAEKLDETTPSFSFAPFFDGFVEFANDPSPVYVYDVEPRHVYDNGIHQEYDRAEIVEHKYQELVGYIRTAFTQGDIPVDPSILRSDKPMTIDEISDAIATHEVLLAQERYDQARMPVKRSDLPAHIEVGSTEKKLPSPLLQIALDFGAQAVHASQEFFSKEMWIIKPKEAPVEAPLTESIATVAYDPSGKYED